MNLEGFFPQNLQSDPHPYNLAEGSKQKKGSNNSKVRENK